MIAGRARTLKSLITSFYDLSRLEGGWVELDCSAAGLARRLAVSSATLSRALDALAGQGVLRLEGSRVQVLQPDALEQN